MHINLHCANNNLNIILTRLWYGFVARVCTGTQIRNLFFFLLSLAFCWSHSLEASLHAGWSRMQKRRKCNHKYLQFAFMVMGLHIPNIKMLADSALNHKMPAVEFTAFVCLFSLKRERETETDLQVIRIFTNSYCIKFTCFARFSSKWK